MAAKKVNKLTHSELVELTVKITIDSVKENWDRNPQTIDSLVRRYNNVMNLKEKEITPHKLKITLTEMGIPFVEEKATKKYSTRKDKIARERIKAMGMLLRKVCVDLGISEDGALNFLNFDDKTRFKKNENDKT